MKVSSRSLLFGFAVCLTLVTSWAEGDDEDKAAEEKEDDKRGSIMRYGRGSVFRYGKRSDDSDSDNFEDTAKRLFRYGKRDELKRLFRYGKRDFEDSDAVADFDDLSEDKRVFRYGKRAGEEDKRVFRYGKRSDQDMASDKRQIFRYGKRADIDDLLEEAKRRIMRYGREARAPQEPHVPFRFGDKE